MENNNTYKELLIQEMLSLNKELSEEEAAKCADIIIAHSESIRNKKSEPLPTRKRNKKTRFALDYSLWMKWQREKGLL